MRLHRAIHPGFHTLLVMGMYRQLQTLADQCFFLIAGLAMGMGDGLFLAAGQFTQLVIAGCFVGMRRQVMQRADQFLPVKANRGMLMDISICLAADQIALRIPAAIGMDMDIQSRFPAHQNRFRPGAMLPMDMLLLFADIFLFLGKNRHRRDTSQQNGRGIEQRNRPVGPCFHPILIVLHYSTSFPKYNLVILFYYSKSSSRINNIF